MAADDGSCSSSSYSRSSSTHDVFLSFRGEDTRNNFTGFLHSALKREGINVFIDGEGLWGGDDIQKALLNAIQISKISIPVFSKGYADSKWCLMELVEIVRCHRSNGQKVLPIFFDVEPRDVRHQTGRSFKGSFQKHMKRYDAQTVKSWKEALTIVAGISGYELKRVNGNQPELVKLAVDWALSELISNHLGDVKNPIGLDAAPVQDLLSLLNVDPNVVQCISGIGGIGKIIATTVHNRIFKSFQMNSFLANVREEAGPNGVVSLIEKLIYNFSKKEVKICNVYERRQLITKKLQGNKVVLILEEWHSIRQMSVEKGKRHLHDFSQPKSKQVVGAGAPQGVVEEAFPRFGRLVSDLEAFPLLPSGGKVLVANGGGKVLVANGGGNSGVEVQAREGGVQWATKKKVLSEKIGGRARSDLFAKSSFQCDGFDLSFEEPAEVDGRLVARCHSRVVEEEESQWRNALVGHFIGWRPDFPFVRESLLKQWKLSGDVDMHFLDSGVVIFKFQVIEDRERVLEDGPWSVMRRLLILRPWTPQTCLKKINLKSIPLWIRLPNLPFQYWSAKSLSTIASVLGKPIAIDKRTKTKEKLSFAKVCVEVSADKVLPRFIPIYNEDGFIFDQEIEYEWLPPRCSSCNIFGHGDAQCGVQNKPAIKRVWRPKSLVDREGVSCGASPVVERTGVIHEGRLQVSNNSEFQNSNLHNWKGSDPRKSVVANLVGSGSQIMESGSVADVVAIAQSDFAATDLVGNVPTLVGNSFGILSELENNSSIWELPKIDSTIWRSSDEMGEIEESVGGLMPNVSLTVNELAHERTSANPSKRLLRKDKDEEDLDFTDSNFQEFILQKGKKNRKNIQQDAPLIQDFTGFLGEIQRIIRLLLSRREGGELERELAHHRPQYPSHQHSNFFLPPKHTLDGDHWDTVRTERTSQCLSTTKTDKVENIPSSIGKLSSLKRL